MASDTIILLFSFSCAHIKKKENAHIKEKEKRIIVMPSILDLKKKMSKFSLHLWAHTNNKREKAQRREFANIFFKIKNHFPFIFNLLLSCGTISLFFNVVPQ